MPQPPKTLLAPLLALLVAGGCAPGAGSPPSQALADLGSLQNAGIVPNNGANLIANNSGSLTGTIHGPSAALVANNAGSLVGNHAAGLAPRTGYGLLAASALEPVVGARVAVFDDRGQRVSVDWTTTDGQGHYRFEGLRPSGRVIFVRAEYALGGTPVSLSAIAGAPREPGDRALALNPATTLVSKKVEAMLKQEAITAGELDPEALARAAEDMADELSETQIVAAAVLSAEDAAKTFDAVVAASPAFRQSLGRLGSEPLSAPTATPAPAGPGTVTTVAGATLAGYADGTGSLARFNYPYAVAAGPGGTLYVSDYKNHSIRKIGPDGSVSTLAGDGTAGYADGPGSAARFNGPRGLAVDAAGHVYVADGDNARIRKIAPDGSVSTLAGNGERGFADGPAEEASFSDPRGLALDGQGQLLVADTGNMRIRMISSAGDVATAFELEPQPEAQARRLKGPYGVAVGTDGTVYVADASANAILKGVPGEKLALWVGGEGASFDGPTSLAVGADGAVYMTDFNHHAIRRIAADGGVTLLAGGQNVTGQAPFYGPYGLCLGADGHLYVADTSNHRIRRLLLR